MKRRTDPPLSAIQDLWALWSIWHALEARPRELAARLRDGQSSHEEMKLVADLIEQKIKPRRPSSTRDSRFKIALFVWLRRKVNPNRSRKDAICEAVDRFKVSERHVYNAVSEFDDNALRHIERMGESKYEPGRQLAEERAWREILKGADRDLLLDMCVGLLAEKFPARK